MGVAGNAVQDILDNGIGVAWNRVFFLINDSAIPAVLKTLLRIFICQIVPFTCRSGEFVVYTTHHGPFWRTGRHLLIVHDLICLSYPDQHKFQTLYFRKLLPVLASCSNMVVAISQCVKSEITNRYPSVDVPVCVVPSMYRLKVGLRCDSFESRLEDKRLLVVGGRYSHKNIDTVLESFLRLVSKDSGWNLVLVGFDRRIWWQDYGGFDLYPCKDNVIIFDYLSDEELEELYASSFLLLYPSLAEGMGLPPLEAYSAGCLPVVHDMPIMHETCGEGALRCDCTQSINLDEVISIVASTGFCTEYSDRVRLGREHAKRFSYKSVTDNWQALARRIYCATFRSSV